MHHDSLSRLDHVGDSFRRTLSSLTYTGDPDLLLIDMELSAALCPRLLNIADLCVMWGENIRCDAYRGAGHSPCSGSASGAHIRSSQPGLSTPLRFRITT